MIEELEKAIEESNKLFAEKKSAGDLAYNLGMLQGTIKKQIANLKIYGKL